MAHFILFLRFLNDGAVWMVFLVCALRFCKRIEPAAVVRLVTPVLWVMAVASAVLAIQALGKVKDAWVHNDLGHLQLLPANRFGHPAWVCWLQWIASLVPLAFALPVVRRSFCTIAAIAAFLFFSEHYPYFALLFKLSSPATP